MRVIPQARAGGSAMTVWIDQRTFLLRRIDRTMSLGKGSRVDSVTTYEPELDGDIPADALAFGR
jgi:hypothetical protein